MEKEIAVIKQREKSGCRDRSWGQKEDGHKHCQCDPDRPDQFKNICAR